MGQQQILLIVLSVILVGIAIAVGITMFRAQAVQSNLDAIIADLNNLGAMAYQFRIRPVSMGGGGGTYFNATDDISFAEYFEGLPESMTSNENGDYVVSALTANSVTISGWSSTNNHGRSVIVAQDGAMTIRIDEEEQDPFDD